MEQETINLKVDGTVKSIFQRRRHSSKGDLLFELDDEDLAISLKNPNFPAQQQLS